MAKKRGGRINKRDFVVKPSEDIRLYNPDRLTDAQKVLAKAKAAESKYKHIPVRIDSRTVVLKKVKNNK